MSNSASEQHDWLCDAIKGKNKEHTVTQYLLNPKTFKPPCEDTGIELAI